jgi:fructose-1,6-bisphosphatase I
MVSSSLVVGTGQCANFGAAGGKAINSKMDRMLEVVPEHIHDRSGIFMGSEEEVQKVVDAHKKYQK